MGEMATYEDLRRLSLRIGELLRSPDVDGVVWVQGTNTIEGTAYFLSLTVQDEKPIVVTGAQRPYNGLSTDGPINLLDAIRLAAAPETRGRGAVARPCSGHHACRSGFMCGWPPPGKR